MFALGGLWAVVGLGIVCLFVVSALIALAGFRVIPNTRIGVVERRWSARGSVRSGLIALQGEAGFLPDVLRGGVHYRMPIQYRVHVLPLVTIPQGRIGYVFARDGQPLAPTQALASNATAKDFQDVRAFLDAGGQRGPQRAILREGTYAINLAEFIVVTDSAIHRLVLNKEDDADFGRMAAMIQEREGFKPLVIKGGDDLLAIVTTHDGPSLPQGEIIAPVVGDDPKDLARYHNDFQDPECFLAAGGFRGRQLQVLVEGTYYVNRLFATVEMVPKTVVEVGTVGVVVSYTGDAGVDLSGEEYKHGELVEKGRRGVWSTPLLPGKYAFNTYAGKVVIVPTTNFILKWNRFRGGAAPLRREPGRGVAHHEGRFRAVAPALRGRAHRLLESASWSCSASATSGGSSEQTPRPDGLGLLQEQWGRPGRSSSSCRTGARSRSRRRSR